MKKYLLAALTVFLSMACRSTCAALVDYYSFDDPMPGNPTQELDQGTDNTPITLFNNAQRVAGGAFSGSGFALKTGPVAGDSNNDFKAGILFTSGSVASTLDGTGGVNGITIMGWFKPLTAPTANTTLIALLRGDGSGVAVTDNQGRARLGVYQNELVGIGRRSDAEVTNSSYGVAQPLSTTMPVNLWSFLTLVIDYGSFSTPPTITLYRDGVSLGSTVVTSWDNPPVAIPTPSSLTASDGLAIGGQLFDDSEPFNGLIDDVRIYNQVLTQSQVSQVFHGLPIPEPSAAGLLLGGVAAAALTRGKRKSLWSSCDPGRH